jgi:hypothetical protein
LQSIAFSDNMKKEVELTEIFGEKRSCADLYIENQRFLPHELYLFCSDMRF